MSNKVNQLSKRSTGNAFVGKFATVPGKLVAAKSSSIVPIKADWKNRIIDAYWATWTKDSVGDKIQKGAFKKTIEESGPKPYGDSDVRSRIKTGYNHNTIIGLPIDMEEDSKGLRVVSRIDDTQLGNEVLKMCKSGTVDTCSFLYNVMASTPVDDGETNLLQELKMFEGGPVDFPANQAAEIIACKNNIMRLANVIRNEGSVMDFLGKSGARHSKADLEIMQKCFGHIMASADHLKCLMKGAAPDGGPYGDNVDSSDSTDHYDIGDFGFGKNANAKPAGPAAARRNHNQIEGDDDEENENGIVDNDNDGMADGRVHGSDMLTQIQYNGPTSGSSDGTLATYDNGDFRYTGNREGGSAGGYNHREVDLDGDRATIDDGDRGFDGDLNGGTSITENRKVPPTDGTESDYDDGDSVFDGNHLGGRTGGRTDKRPPLDGTVAHYDDGDSRYDGNHMGGAEGGRTDKRPPLDGTRATYDDGDSRYDGNLSGGAEGGRTTKRPPMNGDFAVYNNGDYRYIGSLSGGGKSTPKQSVVINGYRYDIAAPVQQKAFTACGDSGLPLADADTPWDAGEAVAALKAHFSGPNGINFAHYRRAFLACDSANTDKQGGYKLPFATIVGGTLKAVPRALADAAGRLNQTNGLSPAVKASIKAKIAHYYKKLGKPTPFDEKCDGEMSQNVEADSKSLQGGSGLKAIVDTLSQLRADNITPAQQKKSVTCLEHLLDELGK